jgi:tetratricopeptide (TPR) repeat protein
MKSLHRYPLFVVYGIVAMVICQPCAAADATTRTASQWLDNGALLSAYGNYDGAIKSYRKALELTPDATDAMFQLGVCYGEVGMYDQAIHLISQAIDRRPGVGAYYYGRGRVYLVAGNREEAMNDFMEAGVLGHQDARHFLESQSGVTWE